MSNREYDGPALDMSWQDPPWADNEGETVAAVDSNGGGEVTTTVDDGESVLFSDEWQPTEGQVAAARRLLLNTDVTGQELADRLGLSSGMLSTYMRGYHDVDPDDPGPITGTNKGGEYELLAEHDRDEEGAEQDSEDASTESDVTPLESIGSLIAGIDGAEVLTEGWEPTEEQVTAARRVLLETDVTGAQLARHLDAQPDTFRHYVCGRRSVDPDVIGPISGNNKGEYHIADEADNNNRGEVYSGPPPALSEDDVVTARERLIAGETAREVAEDYDIDASTMCDYAAGRKHIDPDEVTVTYVRKKGWTQADGTDSDASQAEIDVVDTELHKDSQSEQTTTTSWQPTADTETETAGHDSAQGRAVAAFVLGAVFLEIIRRLRGN